MNATALFGLCAAVLAGIGVYGLIASPHPLRKIVALNVLGNGIFLACAVIARRGAAAGMGGDPVPQARLITAIVVAFAATALGLALTLRLHEEGGAASLSDEGGGGAREPA